MGNNQTKANDFAPSEAQISACLPQGKPDSHKIKPIIKSHVAWRCLTPFDIPYINKYKPKMISHVTLTNLHSRMAGTRSIRSLRKALVDSKRVSSIRIDKLDVRSKELILLFHSTNHWKKFSFSSMVTTQQLTEIVSRFGRCKDLTFLPLGFERPEIPILQNVNAEMLNQIRTQLIQLNRLESLILDIPLCNNAAPLNYKPPVSLQHLHLNFQNKTGFRQRELSSFLTNIQQKCHKLEHLRLSFSQAYLSERSDVQIWTSFFENAPKSLKKLTISIFPNRQQQPEETQSFFESFKNLKNLTFLNLSFFNTLQINHSLASSENFFPSLFTTLQSFTQLEELRLNLSCFPSFRSADLNHLASTLQHFENLNNLYMNLTFLQSPDEDFVTLSQSLRQLNNIQIMDLKFADKVLTQKSLEAFSNNIAHLNLTSLSINHNDMLPNVIPAAPSGLRKLLSFWKRNSLMTFLSDIGNFTQLSHLNIRLADTEISPKECKCLTLVLKQLSKLSSLCLNLPKFHPHNNFEGLRNLVSCFKDLPKLTDLALTFEQDICDQQVRLLSESLISCKSIRSLSLSFNSASQLHDISLYCLLYGIRHLLTLDILNLDFGTCEIFNDFAVVEFLLGLTVLKDLSWINFIFNSTFLRHRVTPLPVNLKGFYKMKKLRHFVAGPSHFI